MKTAFTLMLAVSIGLLSCQPSDSVVDPKDALEKLYQRFHGKYKLISVLSSEPLDVNFDGVASTDLMSEMSALTANGPYLELRVKYPDRPVFLFAQFWPEQYIYTYTGSNLTWNGRDTLSYDPKRSVHYAEQAAPYAFAFSDDMSHILVKPNDQSDQIRWTKPESVFIEAQDRLRLVNRRHIYTRAGVKEVLVTTYYERFTMAT